MSAHSATDHGATDHGATSHAGAAPHTGHEQGEHHHHVNVGTFVKVFFALCVLTLISFLAARYIQPPQVSWAIMMAVSCAKALLVITFFMHLLWEASWKYVLTIPASLMSILLVLLLVPDIGRRTHTYSEERWRHAATPQAEDEESEHHDEDAANEAPPH